MTETTEIEAASAVEGRAKNDLLCSLHARYEKDFAWRSAWNELANSPRRRGRWQLQTQQEYIEHRAQLANLRIAKLMREYDVLRT